MLLKCPMPEKYLITINIYVPNSRPSKHMRQKLTELKGQTDSCRKIIEDFSTPLSIIGRKIWEKLSKKLGGMNNAINWIEIYGTLYWTKAECIFFSRVHWTFSSIDHMFAHKLSLDIFYNRYYIKYIIQPQWQEIRNQ